jgi:hypothetical protein
VVHEIRALRRARPMWTASVNRMCLSAIVSFSFVYCIITRGMERRCARALSRCSSWAYLQHTKSTIGAEHVRLWKSTTSADAEVILDMPFERGLGS